METALHKVDTPLMERYLTTCENCKYERQFFGTKDEARQSAVTMGWEFRRGVDRLPLMHESPVYSEAAYCPHCKLLVP